MKMLLEVLGGDMLWRYGVEVWFRVIRSHMSEQSPNKNKQYILKWKIFIHISTVSRNNFR